MACMVLNATLSKPKLKTLMPKTMFASTMFDVRCAESGTFLVRGRGFDNDHMVMVILSETEELQR